MTAYSIRVAPDFDPGFLSIFLNLLFICLTRTYPQTMPRLYILLL
jgi:hypothetical protein